MAAYVGGTPFLMWLGLPTAVAVGAAALTVELPARVVAWQKGQEGEERVGLSLEAHASDRMLPLHDRAIPGRRENIDHIVVATSGVFTVETKNYSGELAIRSGRLLVGRRDRSSVLAQAQRQAQFVTRAMAAEGIALRVTPLVCFAGSAKPRQTTRVGDVWVADLPGTLALLSDPRGDLLPANIRGVAEILTAALPPAATGDAPAVHAASKRGLRAIACGLTCALTLMIAAGVAGQVSNRPPAWARTQPTQLRVPSPGTSEVPLPAPADLEAWKARTLMPYWAAVGPPPFALEYTTDPKQMRATYAQQCASLAAAGEKQAQMRPLTKAPTPTLASLGGDLRSGVRAYYAACVKGDHGTLRAASKRVTATREAMSMEWLRAHGETPRPYDRSLNWAAQ